ncbi:MAG: VacJ lipoprotein [Alphaproteobacteria bacterium MedPE-SWcel]|nr:MAG: VacJ lipoprotein [Alphaproteobacteria bacterium MedPE-SWcel]
MFELLKKPVLVVALSSTVLTAACATQDPVARASGEIFDPYENTNRSIHQFNKGLDRYAFRPASKGYVTIVPPDMVTAFGNFAENLSKPGDAVNYLLQGNIKGAGQALGRFAVNTIFGIGGLGDPATDFKMAPARTDFGETLHVWGAGEGAYVELPGFGPSTTRDAVGIFVDFFTNPLSQLENNPAEDLDIPAKIVDQLGNRGTYSDTIDSILYESADSYAQSRQIYLQNRRFELGQENTSADIDPFELDTGGF